MVDFSQVNAALADPARSANNRARDANRHPLQMLSFIGIEPGQRVLELVGGDYYWTNLFRFVLGDSSPELLWSMNPTEWTSFIAPYVERALGVRAPLQNPNGAAAFYSAPFRDPAPSASDNSFDLVFSYANYHDLTDMAVDRRAMNRRIHEILRPGGSYVVVDHAAIDGSGIKHSGSNRGLHRIDEALVVREITAAGFELGDEGMFLRFPEEDRLTLAWVINGKQPRTDRFCLRFRKMTTRAASER